MTAGSESKKGTLEMEESLSHTRECQHRHLQFRKPGFLQHRGVPKEKVVITYTFHYEECTLLS